MSAPPETLMATVVLLPTFLGWCSGTLSAGVLPSEIIRRLSNLFIEAGKAAMCFDMHGM